MTDADFHDVDWKAVREAQVEEKYRKRKFGFVFFPTMALGVVLGNGVGLWLGLAYAAGATLFAYALERWVH